VKTATSIQDKPHDDDDDDDDDDDERGFRIQG